MSIEQAQSYATQHGLPFWVVLLFGTAVPTAVYVLGLYAKRTAGTTPAPALNVSQVVDMLLAELARAREMLAAVQPQIDAIYAARIALLDVVSDLYGAAVAGRAMVHDLERQLGRPETVFPQLPPIPTMSELPGPSAEAPNRARAPPG